MSKRTRFHLNQLYKDPLPLVNVIPLPPIIPHNPLSLLICLYHYLTDRPTSDVALQGRLDRATHSVWLADPQVAHRAWHAGFFGKGTFSRSQPSWHVRMQRLLGIIGPDEQLVSEEVTERRREARQAMKRERARLQRVERDRLLREERGLSLFEEDMVGQTQVEAISHSSVEPNDVNDGLLEPIIASIPDLEHLQLTLYEALFLAVALDALSIIDEETERAIRRESVLAVLIDTVHLQACPMMQEVPADNAFLVQYAVYHHYRAHGWTVKPGIKFGVDWILYERGPVFSHADYSIVVLPDPRHENDPPCIQKQRPWWWLHAINRVNAQVKKTVILCYVSFDASRGVRLDQGLKAVLQRYLIREVGIKRWSAARNR